MKKVIITITLILALAIVSGYKISRQNDESMETAKQASVNNIRNTGKTESSNSDSKSESSVSDNSTENKPRVLLMLNNDTGLSKWSPSLWWNYHHAKAGQPGC